MEKSLIYIVFTCFFVFNSWGQEKDAMFSSKNSVEEDASPKLSRFLQNIEIDKDYDFSFDRNFLSPRKISLRKMLNTRYYNSIQHSKEVQFMETLYPNSRYPNGILIDGNRSLLIKPFPEVTP